MDLSGYLRWPCCYQQEFNCPNEVWQRYDACAECQVCLYSNATAATSLIISRRWEGHRNGRTIGSATDCTKTKRTESENAMLVQVIGEPQERGEYAKLLVALDPRFPPRSPLLLSCLRQVSVNCFMCIQATCSR